MVQFLKMLSFFTSNDLLAKAITINWKSKLSLLKKEKSHHFNFQYFLSFLLIIFFRLNLNIFVQLFKFY